MTATYDYGAYTVNGKNLHLKWLEADINEVTIRNVGATTVGNSGYYGVNGTFFDNSSSSSTYGYLTGIAIQNGSIVRQAGGTQDYTTFSSGGRGALVKLSNNLADGTFLFEKRFYEFPVTHNGYTIQQSNVQWAIGGISLYLGETLTESAFNSRMVSEKAPSYSSNVARTAIGYKGANKVILCTFFDGNDLWNGGKGCTIWDVRTVMKDKFGCTMGVNLDGGGSTQIRFKQGTSSNYHETEARKIFSMVTVPM
ncbi:hypothetical protein J31TS4_38350 [Paenibacillus sp. J31TS4]|uniref:phosphodiester glycosidase family protein n=1 Tax=Paenibacillus sp. J31TS4 TaxID=2807195 RepID=UPI001B269791|nr:phosphodiester glycosidase family protein [Paenibacillus sp. J31TS4]GIP40555.1 hypothetical protein J31TS4_38350 [Paenibacillus sp. J31TS4]